MPKFKFYTYEITIIKNVLLSILYTNSSFSWSKYCWITLYIYVTHTILIILFRVPSY